MAIEVRLEAMDILAAETDLLAVPVLQGTLGKNKTVKALDEALGGALKTAAEAAEFDGKAESVVDLPTLGHLPAKRILLVGIGDKRAVDDAAVRLYGATAARTAASTKCGSLVVVEVDKATPLGLRSHAEGVVLGAYTFTKYLTGDRAPKVTLAEATIVTGNVTAPLRKAVALGVSVGEAVCIARDAVNEPPNELYPESLAARCEMVAKTGKLKIKVLDKKGIAAAGMKLHYAVGQGSEHEPRFIHMTYKPRGAKKKIVFVGKGITFDAGGLCIKPAPGMGEMKGDMGGAAAVLGVMAAVAAVKPTVEVHGIIGAAENMPDGAAYRPGDVFGSLDGKFVEIINTDAEGRLVLADALTYAHRLEPDLIVDAATLTGACIVALGKLTSAYYASTDGLAKQMDKAAKEAGESFWRMPLADALREQLRSDVADLKHTGDRWGGSITAALFLREFTGGKPWIHCDIAGPSFADKPNGFHPKGGTGHPVLTFLRLVEQAG